MISWILLLGTIYITSILCYDIYKEYKTEHHISLLRVVAIGICLFYVVRFFCKVL